MITEFLLVCVPAESQLAALGINESYADNPVLFGGPRDSPTFAPFRSGGTGVELLWPPCDKSNGGTFYLYGGEQSQPLLVPSDANARALGNGQNSDLLYFLAEPPRAEKLLLTRPKGKARRFERGQVEPKWFPEPHGAHTARCPLFTRSFASVGGAATSGFTKLRIEVDAATDRPPVAVLNPLVFRVQLAGDELPPSDDVGVTLRSALRDVIVAASAESGLLHLEPVLPAEVDPRVHALDAQAAAVSDRTVRSVVEELLLGPPGGAGWLPFLCLDLLSGRFWLNHPATAPGKRWKSWGFPKAERAPNNARWFAKYWVERWGGQYDEGVDAAEKDTVIELPPGERDPDQREQFAATGLRPSKKDYDAAYASCRTFVELLLGTGLDAAPDADRVRRFLKWAAPLVEQLPANVHQQFVRRPKPGGTVELKLDGLMHALAGALLFPQSPVLVEPPPVERVPDPARQPGYTRVLGGKVFDLRRSVRWYARDFGLRAVTALGPTDPIRWKNGWWQEWYDRLFVPGAGPDFTFVPDDSGFVLDESRLGLDVLGAGAGRYEQGELIVL